MKNESKLLKQFYPDAFYSEMKSWSKTDILEQITNIIEPSLLDELNKITEFEGFFDFFLKNKENLGNTFNFAAEIDGKIVKGSSFYILEKIFKYDHQDINFFSFTTDPNAEIKEIISEVSYHMDNSNKDPILFEKLSEKFPEFTYLGSAFRLLKTSQYQKQPLPGSSFSLNKEGILHFINSDPYALHKEFTLIEHNIRGFNLIHFLKQHQEFLEGESSYSFEKYKFEDEVVLLEDIAEVQVLSFKNLDDLIQYLKK